MEHIGGRYLGKPYQVLRLGYEVGRKLSLGEESPTGVYAILSSRNSRVLRASLCPTTAAFLADGEDRFLAEMRLLR